MAKLPTQTRDLIEQDVDIRTTLNTGNDANMTASYLTATTATGTPPVGSFYSKVIGRAPLMDPSKMAKAYFGTERIMFRDLEEVVGEYSPDGQSRVFSTGDERVRCWGVNMSVFNHLRPNISAKGNYLHIGGGTPNTVEITFYGTGIAVLFAASEATNRGVVPSLNGVVGPSVDHQGSGAISDQNYSINVAKELYSGLTLGVHTVSIDTSTFDAYLAGVEILNETSTLELPASSYIANGTVSQLGATSLGFSSYDIEYQDGSQSVTDSTKGGHALVYAVDGVAMQAINYTDSVQQTMGSTDHSNEEIVQDLYWGDFGAGNFFHPHTLRPSGTQDKGYTLPDGVTTLVLNDTILVPETPTLLETKMKIAALNGFVSITFVGTGLDIVANRSPGTLDDHYVYLGDTQLGLIDNTYMEDGDARDQVLKICSGLPYGTHTVKIIRTVFSQADLEFGRFRVYAPKKPELPSGVGLLSSYYKMADFVLNTTSGAWSSPGYSGAEDVTSQGIILRQPTRGVHLEGTWTLAQDNVNNPAMSYIWTQTDGDFAEFEFFGTGIVLKSQIDGDSATNVQMELDGSTDFTSYTTGVIGPNISFNNSTGVFNQNAVSNNFGGLYITDLPLGWHKIKMTRNSGGAFFRLSSMEVVQPTYSYTESVMNTRSEREGHYTMKQELLTPGASTAKKTFLGGVDLGTSKTKWAKIYTGTINLNAIGNNTIPHFNLNLTPGKTYRFTVHLQFTSLDPAGEGDTEVSVQLRDNGQWFDIGRVQHENFNNPGGWEAWGDSFTLSTIHTMVTNNFSIHCGSPAGTFFMTDTSYLLVEELPNHQNAIDEWKNLRYSRSYDITQGGKLIKVA